MEAFIPCCNQIYQTIFDGAEAVTFVYESHLKQSDFAAILKKSLSKDIKNYYTPKLAPLLKSQGVDYLKNFIDNSLKRNSNKLDMLADKSNELAASLFTNEAEIRQAHKFTSNFISYLGKKYKGDELNSKIIKIGTFLASQAQIGDDSFTIINNQLTDIKA